MSLDTNTKSLLLVVNPKAGKGLAASKLMDFVAIFTKANYRVTVYPTTKTGTACYVKDEAPFYDLVVCVGGDGTLSEVIAGVTAAGGETPIGYIPMGSTNDFANSIGLPKNPHLAALAITRGVPRHYDIGTINGRPFSYIAAAGAFTEASYSAPQKLKNSLGHFAYILEGAKCLTHIKSFQLKALFDGKACCGNYIYASVSNTTSVGGIIKLNKDAVDFCDGTFELLLVKKPRSLAQAVELISDIMSKKLKSPCIELHHIAKAKLVFDTPTNFSIDGEKGEACTEAVIVNRHKAVTLIVPKRSPL